MDVQDINRLISFQIKFGALRKLDNFHVQVENKSPST